MWHRTGVIASAARLAWLPVAPSSRRTPTPTSYWPWLIATTAATGFHPLLQLSEPNQGSAQRAFWLRHSVEAVRGGSKKRVQEAGLKQSSRAPQSRRWPTSDVLHGKIMNKQLQVVAILRATHADRYEASAQSSCIGAQRPALSCLRCRSYSCETHCSR